MSPLRQHVLLGDHHFSVTHNVAEIMELLQAGPDRQQFSDGRWTTARIRELIGLKYDVWYDQN